MVIRHSGRLLVRHSRTSALLPMLRDFRALEQPLGYTLQPLFQQEGAPAAQLSEALQWRGAYENGWSIAEPTRRTKVGRHAWEQAHDYRRAASAQAGLADARSGVYAEPDLFQSAEVYASHDAVPPDQDFYANWPRPATSLAWHRDAQHSQLADAAANADNGRNVRMAILDTGFDPKHRVQARGINTVLAKDFFVNAAGDPGATDPCPSGILRFPGHGNATLSLLAGGNIVQAYAGKYGPLPDYHGDLGGAPDAEVIPIRISDSVVHFWTSTMALGLGYASALPGGPAGVISISHGGVPAQSWAKAVNDAYERGAVIVAASGDNYNGLPTRNCVYPARFRRVLSACGVCFDGSAYMQPDFVVQGNYGPDSVMQEALAAFTPNVLWARASAPSEYDHSLVEFSGGGTSASTPQIAAAAALWLAKWGARCSAQPPWFRVEAVRTALFESAGKPSGMSAYFGNGTLKAFDAQASALVENILGRSLPMAPPAEVSFPFLRILLGLPEPDAQDDVQQMYDTEAAQVAMRFGAEFEATLHALPADTSRGVQRAVLDRFIASPLVSPTLRAMLVTRRGQLA